MAQPSTRQELIDYCLRKLGAPVLEINVAEEQIEDLVDDSLQFFHERHFDGVYQTFLKYKITQADIDRGKAKSVSDVGVDVTDVSTNVAGVGVTFSYFENGNYLKVPDYVTGVNKIFRFEGSNSVSSGMFSIKYQLFLNDIYYWGSTELLTYAMTKTYLEDINFLLTTQKQVRFNKRQDRLYLDIDWNNVSVGQYFVIDCYRLLNPTDYSRVWNDSFIKKYLTSLIKRQWGQNLIKFNGRQLYDDGQSEIDLLMQQMTFDYELPPLDMIG